MKTLIAWDDAQEADLLGLYLTAGENEGHISATADDLFAQLSQNRFDVVLLSATFPRTAAEGYDVFLRIQDQCPGLPIVLGCRPSEMLHLPRFLTHGLRFYLVRDAGGDFVFLVLSSLESAIEAAQAEESRKLAERLREEMEGVRRLQESIIPHGIKPPSGYGIVAKYEPSQVTVVGQQPVVMAGGDYYDVFRPDDRTLVVLVGDASGHGLKACMSIMAMHTLVRMIRGDRYRNTANFVAEINQRLCENSIVQEGGGFITLFYAAIDTVEHTMTWTSAGHPLALMHRRDTGEVTAVGTEADCGLVLGVQADVEYPSRVSEVPPGARLLVYSDGLTDALAAGNCGGAAFGVKGIVDSLRATAADNLETALTRLFRSSSAFTSGDGRHDDTSVVLLERFLSAGPAVDRE
ncbi:MAG TPA: fused response regulator/phosphatase [Gemmataceae bacterium]|nr:fused response regulator/phosphatase [Gemmataceae bacterium]